MKRRWGMAGDDVRRFVRANGAGALATSDAKRSGAPYNAFVTYACDVDGQPLLLLSTLSDHTRNLLEDPRAALLIHDTHGRRNPQTGPRATLTGAVKKLAGKARKHARSRFLGRHPDAALYADFGDFALYRLNVERVHWVGGFAQARWFPARRVFALERKSVTALADCAAGVVEHMNEDHADAVDLYARVLLGRKGSGWRMTGVDPDGCDLRHGGRTTRLAFDEPVSDAGQCRERLVALVKRAREAGY